VTITHHHLTRVWQGFSKISFVTTLVLHYYKHFHSSFTLHSLTILFFILLPLNFNVLFTLRYCQQLFQLQLNLSISKDEKTINLQKWLPQANLVSGWLVSKNLPWDCLAKWTKTWWEAPMEDSILSFLKAEWKVKIFRNQPTRNKICLWQPFL
jgi:hypothetical protein